MHNSSQKNYHTIQDMPHGGDLLRMATHAGCDAQSILDFSVNVRPDGPPEFISAAINRAMNTLTRYPSPHAEEAKLAAAKRYALPENYFVFGNGSNELIHALARYLANNDNILADFPKAPQVTIVEPAFSEYALASQRAGLHIEHAFLPIEDIAKYTSKGSAIFFANPSNPSGTFVSRESLSRIVSQYPDILWIIDEAFIEYADDERNSSLLCQTQKTSGVRAWPKNLIVLRSLTKFHAIPAVRVGFLVAHEDVARGIQNELCAWNVNAFSIAAACAVLNDVSDFADKTRADNRKRREHLCSCLTAVPELEIMPSVANYVLFRWTFARDILATKGQALPTLLLQDYGIAIRDCANYQSLEDGSWFRVAVRFEEDHERLGHALCGIFRIMNYETNEEKSPSAHIILPRKKPALMLQGTSSNAGKSILTAAFCRILNQDGYSVAPFKAQNMSLNSGVTPLGEEMGRAQLVQAQAARVIPDARMNPILLKPHSDTGSQIVMLGKPLGHMGVREYFSKKSELWGNVQRSYDSLASEHDVMVLEGAGSPAEVNLKASDIVNMRMAAHAEASVLLVGDIDRGGVYASFLGTWMTFTSSERRLLRGFLVNRFRGDATLLQSAHDYMLEHTGVPVRGVVPFLPNMNLPEEDMAGFDWDAEHHGQMTSSTAMDLDNTDQNSHSSRPLDIAVIMLRHVSNYTDMEPLTMEPDVRIRPVRHAEHFGAPDLVIIPGSKSVSADLAILRENGLAHCITEHAKRDAWIFGICGGLQILGQQIHDPYGIESSQEFVQGLGLMELSSTFAAEKTLTLVRNVASPLGVPCKGYEIHHGLTTHNDNVTAIGHHGGASDSQGHNVTYVQNRRWATYLHGIFDDDAFRRAFINHIRTDLGLSTQVGLMTHYDIDKALDILADHVRHNVDLTAIYKSMGLK